LKTVERSHVPWVRIPPPPLETRLIGGFSSFWQFCDAPVLIRPSPP
jgi:hypothetical protein